MQHSNKSKLATAVEVIAATIVSTYLIIGPLAFTAWCFSNGKHFGVLAWLWAAITAMLCVFVFVAAIIGLLAPLLAPSGQR